jgi:glucokinase
MAVGADLGGTKLSVVLVDSACEVVHRIWVEHDGEGIAELLAALEVAVAECKTVAAETGGQVGALGVAVAGWLSRDRERVVWAANLGTRDQDLGKELRQRFGLPVVIENDGNAAALSESRAMGSPHCLVLFVLGTGVGGGVILDGKAIVGGGLAGELGHLPVDPGGAQCICGGLGCLELAASGPGIARAARAATSFEVVAAARGGDSAALAVLKAAGTSIGRAVALLVPVIDPDVVVVGGRLAEAAADYLLPAAQTALEVERPLRDVRPAPVLELSRLGPDAGAIGVAQLAVGALMVGEAGAGPRGIAVGADR